MEPSSLMVMVDFMVNVCDLYFFVVKTVGGKRVCILGHAKIFVCGMQLVSDKGMQKILPARIALGKASVC